MTQKILLVDDEAVARSGMSLLLRRQFGDAITIAEAANGVEALTVIPDFRPDIVLLDVEMPVLSGFDVLMQLEARPFQVIFQTAHAEFALKAFEANACDYILKPYSDDRFYAAVKKAMALSQRGIHASLDSLFASTERYLERLAFKVGSRHKIVEIQEIHYFISAEHVTSAYMPTGNFVCDHSLNSLEAKLNPEKFARIHRSAIINLQDVKMVSAQDGMTVTMRDGRALVVAKDRRSRMRPLLLGTKSAQKG